MGDPFPNLFNRKAYLFQKAPLERWNFALGQQRFGSFAVNRKVSFVVGPSGQVFNYYKANGKGKNSGHRHSLTAAAKLVSKPYAREGQQGWANCQVTTVAPLARDNGNQMGRGGGQSCCFLSSSYSRSKRGSSFLRKIHFNLLLTLSPFNSSQPP